MASATQKVRLVGGPFDGLGVRVGVSADHVEIPYTRKVVRSGRYEELVVNPMPRNRVLVKGEDAFAAVYGKDEGDGVWRYLRREVGW